jgi:amino acid transporter
MRDRRAALDEVRKGLALLFIFTVAVTAIMYVAMQPVSVWAAVIGGLRFLVSMSAVMAIVTFYIGLLAMRIVRKRPHAEFDFWPRWGHWTAVSVVMAAAAVCLPIVMIAALYPIIADLPHFRLGMMSFCQAYASAMLEDFSGIKTYLGPATIIAISLALTGYERSRCTGTMEGGFIASAG